MQNIYRNVPYEQVDQLEQASRLMFDLREIRQGLLARHGVEDTASLLERIRSGELPEHPAYQHYLSASILGTLRDAVRSELAALTAPGSGAAAAEPAPPLHAGLKEQIEQHYADRLSGEPQLMQDALIATFDTGLAVELRFAAPDEYALHWVWGEAELSIDTAPGNSPSHLHDEDGKVRPDPITRPGRAPWANVQALRDALLRDPLLGEV